MIRWSAVKVSEAMDMVEEYANQILEPLESAKLVVHEAQKIENLPEYMKSRLSTLASEISSITGGVTPYSKQPYQGSIHRHIEMVRKDLPAGAVESEREHLKNGSQQALTM